MTAAKEAKIEPLRLVTSCMAVSVYLRFNELQKSKSTEYEQDSDDGDINGYIVDDDDDDDGDNYGDDENEYKSKEYDGLNRAYSYHSNTDRFDYRQQQQQKKKKEKKKEERRANNKSKNKCYLIADLSNIACSLSIIECIEKRHSDIVKVHYISGNINCGIWKMINSFSLHVIESFIDGYCGYYRPNIKLTKKMKKKKKRFCKYKYKNDAIVYEQLQQIEDIERAEANDRNLVDAHNSSSSSSSGYGINDNEALKCRFRAQMLCDTVIEHLHDQYKDEEVQIHYEHFYRSFSLQLMLTTNTLHDIALNPFLFAMMNGIDVMLQQVDGKKDKIQIDECVLVGDGGKIPEAVALFNEYFNMNESLSSQPIVSRGCCIVVAVDQELVPSPICLDLLPHSIRMSDATNVNDENCLIIAAQNACPCKKTVTRYTYSNNQTTYNLKFYEGESINNKLCQCIGIFQIQNITKRPKRETKIVIAVHLDRNCIMLVSAEDVSSKPPIQLNVIKMQ